MNQKTQSAEGSQSRDKRDVRAEAGSLETEEGVQMRSTSMSSEGMIETVPVGTVLDEEVVFPASFAQQRLWLLDQIEPNSAANNIPLAFRLRGRLDQEALHSALQTIVERHEPLRTVFGSRNGEPVQIIADSVTVEMPLIDFSALPEERRETEALGWYRQEARRPFNLAGDLMLRAGLLRLGAADHVLFLNMHHIASDGWSAGVLFRELSALYKAFCQGQPSPLPALAIQYADFAVWQREWLRGAELEKQLSYWRQALAGVPAALELPTDRPRPPSQSYRGTVATRMLPLSLVQGLTELSRREGATLFMTLLAAFETLLHRYSGQEDILVGTPIAGRDQAEVEGLIGFFLNTLVLRGDLSGNPSFRTLLSRTRERALAAYAHPDLPFEKLVEELQPPRDLSRSPFFQVMFVLQNVPSAAMKLGELTVTPLPVDSGTAKYDLTLYVTEQADGLEASVEYCTDLFEEATIARLLDHYGTLLEGIVADADEPIGRLPLLSRTERQQMLVQWNDTKADYPHESCVHQLFEAQVKQTPEAVAAAFGKEHLTYRELNQRANRLAHHLRSLGVGPDVLVGIYVERSLDMIVGLLGILKAGGAYAPLDPIYPPDRLAFMLEDARPLVLLTQQKLQAALPPHRAKVVCIDDPDLFSSQNGDQPVIPKDQTAASLAYVLYTSGSTGRPKGVQIPHRAMVNFLTSMRREPGLSANDVLLAVTTLSFDIAGLELFLPLTTGARVVIASREVAADGAQLGSLIQACGATVLQATPATWRLLLEAGWQGSPQLKILCGGEALPQELANELLKRCASLWNMYGPTETTIWSSVYKVEAGKRVLIGPPMANTAFYLLDRQLQPVPVGVPGELYIGGDGLARGYLNRPELTADRFIPDPFGGKPGARLYRTGDLVRYMSDGNIEFLGRIDHQVKIRGFRVELGEIETVLREQAAVHGAVVVAREDVPGDKRIVAYVIAKEPTPPAGGELRAFVRQKLPDYMVPSAVVFLKAFPLTPNGKVDRKALPAPQQSRGGTNKCFLAPRDPLEQQLAKLWEKIFDMEPIGIRDDFFELGGHSLLAVRLFARIEKLTGKNLPLVTLFQAPTIEQLAAILRKEGWEAPWASLVPIKPGGSRSPFYCVHGIGGNILEYLDLAKYMEEDQPFYGLQAIGLDGKRPTRDLTVEQMAAHYIEEIRAFQSRGPYYLGGSSFGGLVAFEMAHQLRAMGEEVALVALLDSFAPGHPRYLPTTTVWRRKWNWWRDRLELHWRNFLACEGRSKLTYVREKAQRWKKQFRWKVQRVRADMRERVDRLFWPEAIRQVHVTGYRAATTYTPKAYSGQITLFRATEQPRGIVPEPTSGWSRWVSGGVEIYDTPGHHGAIVREPRAKLLAQQLTEALGKAQGRSRSMAQESKAAESRAGSAAAGSGNGNSEATHGGSTTQPSSSVATTESKRGLMIPFYRPSIGREEIDEVIDTLENGWLTTGPKTKQFEAEFGQYVQQKHAVALNSCTAALHLALEAIGLQRGQSVIVPTMTFAATAEVVRYFNAKPILADCRTSDFNLDLVDAEAKIVAALGRGEKVAAILPVHYGGQVGDMAGVLRLASRYGLQVIEDAAHCCPAYYREDASAPWKPVGAEAAVSCYSFYANKAITTGEGGMACTQNDAYAERMRIMSLHGISRDAWKRFAAEGSWYYEIVAPGFKYNLTDIAAAIGLHQVRKADRLHRQRAKWAARYTEHLIGVEELILPRQEANRIHSWHLYVVRLKLDRLKIDRTQCITELKQRGIGTSVHWTPLHMHPYYRQTYGYQPSDLPSAASVYPEMISLPLYPDLTEADVEYVCHTLKEIIALNLK